MKHIKLYEQFINEANQIKGSKIVKMMSNADDWGEDTKDQVYTKGNNMVYIDSFYYGQDRALNGLINSWSPGGHFYDYFVEEEGIIPTIVNTFSEYKARGRHKKITDDGIVGVELSFEKSINESAIELLADEIKGAEVYDAFSDGETVQARSTTNTWLDGIPVLKHIARAPKKSVKLPKQFKVVDDSKFGWWYFQIGNVWYGIEQEDYGTPPFEY